MRSTSAARNSQAAPAAVYAPPGRRPRPRHAMRSLRGSFRKGDGGSRTLNPEICLTRDTRQVPFSLFSRRRLFSVTMEDRLAGVAHSGHRAMGGVPSCSLQSSHRSYHHVESSNTGNIVCARVSVIAKANPIKSKAAASFDVSSQKKKKAVKRATSSQRPAPSGNPPASQPSSY